MKNNVKVAVIGSTGKSGTYLVKELINRGYEFKALVRNPENFNIESRLVEVVYGNVDDYETVKSLITGCGAVISTLGTGIPHSKPTIFSTATQNIIRAMNELGKKRYVVVTGLNVDTLTDRKGLKTKAGTEWMYANYPKSTADRQKEYELLLDSGLDWTLVRLPLIELTDEKRKVAASPEDCFGENISATDLAVFLIKQLDNNEFVREAPFLFTI